jgi:hypothetical protein
MSSAASSTLNLFMEEAIQEMLSQRDRLTTQSSSPGATVNEVDASKEIKSLQDRLMAQASSLVADMNVNEMNEHLEWLEKKCDACQKSDQDWIRAVLEMHFSDKVNMDTFTNKAADYSGEAVLCVVHLKDFPSVPLEIGRSTVLCAGTRNSYTTTGEFKDAVMSALAAAAVQVGEGQAQSS